MLLQRGILVGPNDPLSLYILLGLWPSVSLRTVTRMMKTESLLPPLSPLLITFYVVLLLAVLALVLALSPVRLKLFFTVTSSGINVTVLVF